MKKEEFKRIYNDYFDAVRSYIFYRCGDTELATDIAQEVFLKLWEKQKKVDIKKVKGLVYKMAGDLFITKYRRKVLELNYSNTLQINNMEQTPEDQLQFKELKIRYEQALKELPEKQRTVFLMSRLEELKYHEIAERLEISVKAVEKRMKNALAELRKVLQN